MSRIFVFKSSTSRPAAVLLAVLRWATGEAVLLADVDGVFNLSATDVRDSIGLVCLGDRASVWSLKMGEADLSSSPVS